MKYVRKVLIEQKKKVIDEMMRVGVGSRRELLAKAWAMFLKVFP